MVEYIVKISHTRAQNLIGIPKKLAIDGSFDKCNYAKVWLNDEKILHNEGVAGRGGEKTTVSIGENAFN